MKNIDFDTVTKVISEVAEGVILPRFRNLRAEDIEFKIGDDPVTIADKEAESTLSTRLSDLLPGSKVLGEEAFATNQGLLDLFFGESPVWIIDPIDGTRNFTAGNPEFGVIVALAEHNQTVAGWIYDPISKDVVTVEKGAGAWHNGKRLKIAQKPDDLKAMRGFFGDRLVDALEKSSIPKSEHPDFREMTAGSHEYPRLVIDGQHFGKNKPQAHFRASLYYNTPWDDAAGILMHQEAGGYAALWSGEIPKPSDYHRGLALAPDKDSWHEMKNWCQRFCKLPE